MIDMRLKHLLAVCFIFAGTMCSAQSTELSLGLEQSNSQVRVNGSKYSGDLTGFKLSGRSALSQRYFVNFDYTAGSGKVTASDTKDASYAEYSIYVTYGFGQANDSGQSDAFPYFAGLGYLNKELEFDAATYSEANFPVFFGANFELSQNIGLRLMGFAPLDKIRNNRAVDLQLVMATGESSKIVAGYTNYSSKLGNIKQCGAGFELSYRIDF